MLAPETDPFGSAPKELTIKSAKPSPFTSPAPLTENPEKSPSEPPLITKPSELELDSIADNSTAVPSALPNTTVLAPDLLPFGLSSLAPIIRSDRPSPFTSPASLTE